MSGYSEPNVVNSVALHLADRLLAADYLLYWHRADALQIGPTGADWRFNFSTNRGAILADPEVATAVAGAVGLVTIVQALPADPRFVVRLIDDESVGPADVVTVPAVSVEVAAPVPVMEYEIGTALKWRSRHLVVDASLRTPLEQGRFKDLLAAVFDKNVIVSITDHDAGDGSTVGDIMVADPNVASTTIVQGPDALTYQVLLNARLLYVA